MDSDVKFWTRTVLLLAFLATTARAEFSDDQFPEFPDILPRIIAAAQTHSEPFASAVSENTAYYLKSAEYIGSCAASFGRVHAARLFYIRSAVKGAKYPVPRGHTFIVFLDATLWVRVSWSVDASLGRLGFDGTKFQLNSTTLFDFAHFIV